MGQKFAAWDINDNRVALYDASAYKPPESVGAIEISDTQYQAVLSTPGYTIVDGVLVAPVAPTAAQQLAAAQASQIAILGAACTEQILSGFASSALGTAHSYPSKMADQQNLSSSVLSSLIPNLPSGWTTPFWCADSTGAWAFRDHTASQIQQVGQDGKAAILASMSKNSTLATKVMAATTIETVLAVTW